MSSQGGCCGGSRKPSGNTRGEALRTQANKDNAKLNQTRSSPANKTVTVPASTESPTAKTHHGSCCE